MPLLHALTSWPCAVGHADAMQIISFCMARFTVREFFLKTLDFWRAEEIRTPDPQIRSLVLSGCSQNELLEAADPQDVSVYGAAAERRYAACCWSRNRSSSAPRMIVRAPILTVLMRPWRIS